MKKKIICIALLLFLNGCGSKAVNPEVESKNDSLKICALDSTVSLYLDNAINTYKQRYPNVNVTIERVSDEEIGGKLEAELMAGEGADFYVNPEVLFADFYKAQQSGAFENLMPWFEKEEGFSKMDYLDGTFDMYEDTDACYVFPGLVQPYFIAIFKDMEDSLQLQNAEWEKADDFVKNIEKFYEKYPQEKPFSCLDTFVLPVSFYGMRTWKGEENKKIAMLPEVHECMELYKRQAYENGEDITASASYDYETELENLFSRKEIHIGAAIIGIESLKDYIMLGGEEAASLYPEKDSEGNNVGLACSQNMVISASSQNKSNAYEFLKILMQDSYDRQVIGTTNKAENEKILEVNRELYCQDQVMIDGKMCSGLSEKTFQILKQSYIDGQVLPNDYMSARYREHMISYFEDKKDYDTCLNEFMDYMKIYYSE